MFSGVDLLEIYEKPTRFFIKLYQQKLWQLRLRGTETTQNGGKLLDVQVSTVRNYSAINICYYSRKMKNDSESRAVKTEAREVGSKSSMGPEGRFSHRGLFSSLET